MKLSTKIIWGAGFVSVALILASFAIWLLGLFFNGIYQLTNECGTYTFSETQTINTCDPHIGSK